MSMSMWQQRRKRKKVETSDYYGVPRHSQEKSEECFSLFERQATNEVNIVGVEAAGFRIDEQSDGGGSLPIYRVSNPKYLVEARRNRNKEAP